MNKKPKTKINLFTTITSAIILSVISGLISYAIIRHYTKDIDTNETETEVNVYFVIDKNTDRNTPIKPKIILDPIDKPEPILDNTITNKTSLDK